ncbi:flagellar FliJ protein [Lacrimispora xylanisolvens]|uniref:Flagellar FliJ protein n=1 Tax=Lacrimispora xylanisolvens TaxID=384636 RepID=A0A2S6HML9_9FIRM|nr:flagellar export protein FliJ [Hungatella xylanolytica]MTK08052.1 flagellar export protein FliJ [Hungatella sp.]PPK78721.1 flagellar FliJ protein [Hungatella xylanolytica]
MKKFNFPLNTVLNYKDQVLENLKTEHSKILADIAQQERRIEELMEKSQSAAVRYREDTQCGVTVNIMREYERYITFIQQRIVAEQGVLLKLKKKEEQKRAEVIEAKKEKASIDKLKEKKLDQYNKEVLKSEELFIEEFVSNTMSVRSSR